MKRLFGQAGLILGQMLHHVGLLIITLFIALLLGIGALALRLSLGPIQIPYIASQLATAASGQGIIIHIDEAALAWAGYRQGGDAPLFLQLNGIAASNADGVALASIKDARLEFLPRALIGGAAPILVDSHDATFAGSDVPVSLRAAIRLQFPFQLASANLFVSLGAGRLGPPGTDLPITSGTLDVRMTQDAVQLTDGRLRLARIGASAPVILFRGAAHQGADWQGQLTLAADIVQAHDLPSYWPLQAGPQTRRWVMKNITGGDAHNARFVFTLHAPKDLSALVLDDVTGGFSASGLVLTWLRQERPITQLNGRLDFLDSDRISVIADAGKLGGLDLSDGTLMISGVSKRDQTGVLRVRVVGQVADAMQILDSPPVNLAQAVPAALTQATGDLSGTVSATLPFKNDLTLAQTKLSMMLALRNVSASAGFGGLAFTGGALNVAASQSEVNVSGAAQFGGEPAQLSAAVVYAAQPALRSLSMDTVLVPALLHRIGLDTATSLADPVTGTALLALRLKAAAGGSDSAVLDADLTALRLSVPVLAWTKPAGVAGAVHLAAVIGPDGNLSDIQDISATAPALQVSGVQRGDDWVFDRIRIGGTVARGSLTQGSGGSPWRVRLSGSALDARAILSSVPADKAVPVLPKPPLANAKAGAPWQVQINFSSLRLAAAPAPDLSGFTFSGRGLGSDILQADASALDATGQPVSLVIAPAAPAGGHQVLHFTADDGGEALRVLGAYNDLEGGAAVINAQFGGGTAMSGRLTLTKFRLLKAPKLGKVLQSMTIYGMAEAASGPGLAFDRLIAPFSINQQALTLYGARAYSASLGFTASGTIGLTDGDTNLNATVIPAYAINALPGKIPVIGKLFSAEKGGGLFAVRVTIKGQLSDPKIVVNPLSVLTPGVLRDVFGVAPLAKPTGVKSGGG